MKNALIGICVCLLGFAAGELARGQTSEKTPTYYRDVLPVLQQRCQVCHRDGGIAPMALESYEQAKRVRGGDTTSHGEPLHAAVVCRKRHRTVQER